MADIVKQPGHYGIHLTPINATPFLDQVTLHSPISLNNAAKMAGVSVSTMKILNPGIQHSSTDPHGPFALLVPYKQAETFKMKLAALAQNERLAWQEHVVKSRETLAKVAAKYKTTVALLRKVNGLTSNQVHPNQTLLIPPQPENNSPLLASATHSQAAINSQVKTTTVSITTSTEKAITHTTHHTTKVLATHHSPAKHHIIYTVRSGDFINRIAKRYKVTSTELKKWNNISSKDAIHPGQKLMIGADV